MCFDCLNRGTIFIGIWDIIISPELTSQYRHAHALLGSHMHEVKFRHYEVILFMRLTVSSKQHSVN